jgi:hypothetical protein
MMKTKEFVSSLPGIGTIPNLKRYFLSLTCMAPSVSYVSVAYYSELLNSTIAVTKAVLRKSRFLRVFVLSPHPEILLAAACFIESFGGQDARWPIPG